MKVLITGANGLLGSGLYYYLKSQGESVEKFDRKKFSWVNHKENIAYLMQFDCVVHAAANTDVEGCELDPITCYKDNCLLTERLVFAATQSGCKFVYVSSTGIYGTEKTDEPYTEYDSVNPTTHHHKAKWLGEQAVNKHANDALIVRAGWIFGGEPEATKNFVARRIEEALKSKNKKIYSNSQQRGVPTFVGDFVAKLYELIQKNEFGVFNIVNQGTASRFDYVSKIIEIAEIDVDVFPTSASNFNRKAEVSNNEMAITLKLQQVGYDALPFWQDSLEKYIKADLNYWLKEKKKL